MKTILITGGAGFIGSHLTDRLLSQGNKVVVLDNLSLGRKSNLDQALQNPNCTFVEGEAVKHAIKYILEQDACNL